MMRTMLLPTCALDQDGRYKVLALLAQFAGLAFHRARKEKEVWEAEERKALLEAERAAIVAELPADEPHHSDEA